MEGSDRLRKNGKGSKRPLGHETKEEGATIIKQPPRNKVKGREPTIKK